MMVQSVNHHRNQVAPLWLSQAQGCLSLEQEIPFSLAHAIPLGYGYCLSAGNCRTLATLGVAIPQN